MKRSIVPVLAVLAILLAPWAVGAQVAAPEAKPAVEQPKDTKPADEKAAAANPAAAAKPDAAAAPAAAVPGMVPTIKADQTALTNGGKVKISGQATPGKPVFIELWTERQVRSNVFDSKPDKDGKRPYKLYLTEQMPAAYRIYLPKGEATKSVLDKYKAAGSGWSYSAALKDLGADVAFSIPAKASIDAYQSTIMASIIGSRGALLPKLDEKENRSRAMQLTKSRFRSVGALLIPAVDVKPDGSYSAEITISEGGAPGKYYLAASTGKGERSEQVGIENTIAFPNMYMSNSGTSLNIILPFFLTLGVAIFGVLMGAGGGFILNPLLLAIFPLLPHTIVAGTVTPTVLFSQASGIMSYSRIKFINWKLGISIGLAMAAGGFIGPKLTEMITLDQFKYIFGWVLLALAALMAWQTTPGYLEKNKKEQAILKEFKRRAEEAAKNA